MDMFRVPQKSVTVFREKYIQALKKDEHSEEVVTMRAAMDEFHKNLHSIEKLLPNITLLPPDDFSNSQSSLNVNSISKVSQVTTRRAEERSWLIN